MNELITEESGFFWWGDTQVPATQFAPEGAVAGRFKIDDDGLAQLEMEGVLPNAHGPMAMFADDETALSGKSIHGVLKHSNRCVRLSELHRAGGQLKTAGISYEKFIAYHSLICDGPFKETPALQFTGLSISLAGFEEWQRLGSIYSEHDKGKTSARHEEQKSINYESKNANLAIEYGISGPFPGSHRDFELSWTERSRLVYRLNEPASLDSMKDYFGLTADLFILLTGSDFPLDFPTLTGEGNAGRFKFYFRRTLSKAKEIRWNECWTNFVQLRDIFGEIFARWIRIREELGPGVYLYLGTRRSLTLYEEHRFVNLIWGLESLHRKRSSEIHTVTALQEKINRIIAEVSLPKDKRWLEKKLKHAGEPSLEERMFETLRELPLNLDEKALRDFCGHCAKLRNDISHFGGQRHEGNYLEFVTELHKASDAIGFLYHIFLLQEMGIPKEILASHVTNGTLSHQVRHAFVAVGLIEPGFR